MNEQSSKDIDPISGAYFCNNWQDVLWYCAAIATELNTDLNLIAEKNIKKLYKRKNENKIKGDGDCR